MAGDMWRALATRMTEKNQPLVCRKQMTKISIRLEGRKTVGFFFHVWEKSVGRRRQALAP